MKLTRRRIFLSAIAGAAAPQALAKAPAVDLGDIADLGWLHPSSEHTQAFAEVVNYGRGACAFDAACARSLLPGYGGYTRSLFPEGISEIQRKANATLRRMVVEALERNGDQLAKTYDDAALTGTGVLEIET